jgi:dihydrofolate reductase
MRPLRYSINVTLDGCCDHRVMLADEELHRHAVQNLAQADALLFGRVTYEIRRQRGGRRRGRERGLIGWNPSPGRSTWQRSTSCRAPWTRSIGTRSSCEGIWGKAVQQLKRESGKGVLVAGVKLPLALTELGLIDEYEFVVQPRLAGHGPTLFAGLSKHVDLNLVSRLEFGSGAVAMRYEPRK